MGLLRGTPTDEELVALLGAAGDNVQRTAVLLRDLLDDYPERAELAREIRDLEHEGDRIAHDVIHRLNSGPRGGAGREWLPSADGYVLATALDDIVDYAEEAADRLGLYGIEAPMEQASAMADVLVGAAEQVARALAAMVEDSDLAPNLVEIHRLENEGDRISREALGSLFAGGIDPMVVIRWKDIFESLECAVDACERVAHVLEGITLKRR
jgi:uncharacterized protein Yka (UPF0111/DUF47 family)